MAGSSRTAEVCAYLDREGCAERRQVLTQLFGRRAVDTGLDSGVVTALLPGVLVLTRRAGDFTTRLRATSVWLGRRTVVSGCAALVLHGLCDETPRRLTVLVGSHSSVNGPPWMRVVHTDAIRQLVLRDGMRCATRERAVIDAWAESGRERRTTVVLEAMRRSSMRGSAVLRELARLPRVKGRRELIALLNDASAGIQSFLEHQARRTVLNTPDFRRLKRQVQITAMGITYTVDTLHEASKTIIEFDGATVHGTREQKKRDSARDAALAALGYVTVRIGYDDVMTRPAWCREVIRRVIAARSVRARTPE